MRFRVEAPNLLLHWTGSSRFSLLQGGCRWRLLPASELHVKRLPYYEMA